jgi:endonuclease/exonuclease/phosphatase (EEP) superfamily protein YafD
MLLRFLYLAGLAVGVVSLAALLGGSFWAFDLMSHFRMQYLGLLILSGGLLAILKQRKEAGILASFALFNIILILPLFTKNGTPIESVDPSNSHRLMSLNLLSSNHESEAVFAVVATAKPDILLFLEVNHWWQTRLDTQFQQDYPFRDARVREDNFGMSLYSKVPLEDFQVLHLGDAIPTMRATFSNHGKPFHLFGVHFLPPMGKHGTARRDAPLADLPAAIADLPHEVLIVGDFNATPWCFPFRRLLATTELEDSSVGFGFQPTWPTFLSVMSIPIDHCLHTGGVEIMNREIGEEMGSDHLPLIVDFRIR